MHTSFYYYIMSLFQMCLLQPLFQKLLKLRNVIVFEKYSLIFNLMGQQKTRKDV